MRVSYAIVFVSDMKRSVAVYRDVLGMPLRFETSHWTEFGTEGATLALHRADESGSQRDTPPGVPSRPGLGVPSVDEFHKRMLAANVPCLQPPKDLFGARIAQDADPDGLVISVSEDRRG